MKHHKFNILVIGDTGTGKTALVKRYIYGKFSQDSSSTIGIEYESKTVLKHPKCNADLRLALWDAAGQRVFRNLIKGYFNNGDAVVLVVDLCNRRSFESLGEWLSETNALMLQMVPYVVIGNKLDKAKGDDREVSREELMKFVGEHQNMEYIEASALNGKNVRKAFEELIVRIVKNSGVSEDVKKLEVELKSGSAKKGWRRFFCCL